MTFKWLDSIPWIPLVLIAVFLGLSPIGAKPHLIEKIEMLANLNLVKPLDVFDLLLHGLPILLLLMKFMKVLLEKKKVS